MRKENTLDDSVEVSDLPERVRRCSHASRLLYYVGAGLITKDGRPIVLRDLARMYDSLSAADKAKVDAFLTTNATAKERRIFRKKKESS
jgi:hypothetical protein